MISLKQYCKQKSATFNRARALTKEACDGVQNFSPADGVAAATTFFAGALSRIGKLY
jgi:hypothetical protein